MLFLRKPAKLFEQVLIKNGEIFLRKRINLPTVEKLVAGEYTKISNDVLHCIQQSCSQENAYCTVALFRASPCAQATLFYVLTASLKNLRHSPTVTANRPDSLGYAHR